MGYPKVRLSRTWNCKEELDASHSSGDRRNGRGCFGRLSRNESRRGHDARNAGWFALGDRAQRSRRKGRLYLPQRLALRLLWLRLAPCVLWAARRLLSPLPLLLIARLG